MADLTKSEEEAIDSITILSETLTDAEVADVYALAAHSEADNLATVRETIEHMILATGAIQTRDDFIRWIDGIMIAQDGQLIQPKDVRDLECDLEKTRYSLVSAVASAVNLTPVPDLQLRMDTIRAVIGSGVVDAELTAYQQKYLEWHKSISAWYRSLVKGKSA